MHTRQTRMKNYAEALDAFMKRTNESEVLSKKIGEVLRSWRPLAEGRVKRVLDVGCGPGDRTIEIFDLMKSLGNDVRLDGVEPSTKFRKMFSAKIGGRAIMLHGTDYEHFDCYDFDEEEQKYDLVIFSHSLYHMDFDAIGAALGQKRENGRILVAIESGASQMHKMRRDFYPILSYDMIGYPVCGDDVMRQLHFLRVPYTAIRADGQVFDVTDAVYGDMEKPEIRSLVQFMLHLVEPTRSRDFAYAREWIEKNAKTEIETDVERPSTQSTLSIKVKRYYLEIGDDIIFTE